MGGGNQHITPKCQKGRINQLLNSFTYLSVHGVHVYVSFLGPLLPEFRIIESDVGAVLGGHKAGFGESGAFAFALNRDGGGSPLQDLIDVLLTEAAAFVVLIHDGGVGTFPQQILNLFFGELLDL